MTEQVDVDALKALAEAATPGPWEALGRVIEQTDWSAGKGEVVSCEVNCGSYCQGGTGKGVESSADANFIAAANPATIIALLDRLERAEAAIAALADEAWAIRNEFVTFWGKHSSDDLKHVGHSPKMPETPRLDEWYPRDGSDGLAALDTGKEKKDE